MAFLLVLWLCPINSQAQLTELEHGAVYHFTNVGDATLSLTVNNIADVGVAATNTEDTKQQWLCTKSGNYYILTNINNGQFLRGAGESTDWFLTPSPSTDFNLFELVAAGDTNNSLRSKANSNDGYAYMHRTGDNIVGWETTPPTQWTITKIEYDVTALLNILLPVCESIINSADDGSYTKIGAYKSSVVKQLKNAVADAKVVLAGGAGYYEAYDRLYAEFSNVINAKNATVPFSPSLTYVITNYSYTGETVVASNGYVSSNNDVDKSTDAAKWQFKETASAGVYKVYNLSGVYASTIEKSSHLTTTDEAGAPDYKLVEFGNGAWTIALTPESKYTKFHSSYNRVVGWSVDAAATRWNFTAVECDDLAKAEDELQTLVTETDELIDKVADVTYTMSDEALPLTTNEGSDYYIWTNATNTGNNSEGPIANLVDGKIDNFFHTQWEGTAASSDGLDHYIEVDLGENNELSSFYFTYTTRPNNIADDFPQEMLIYGSNDKVNYKKIGHISSGMPIGSGKFYESPVIDGVDEYRYLRFMVTKTNKERKNATIEHNYWHMAEFDIYPATAGAIIKPEFQSYITSDVVHAAYKEKLAASILLANSPTNNEVNTKYAALSEKYTALDTQWNSYYTAKKNELQTLIDKTSSLVNEICKGELTLTTDNFYCNAPYTTNKNTVDYSANYVDKLTDGNNSTFLHTRWDANSDDGEFHYLRVDAGDTGINSFYFNYITASRGKYDMPGEIVVEGSNSENSGYAEIVTLGTDVLPQDLSKNSSYKSDILSTGDSKYRYIRFKVTDIGANESDGHEHPFFTMSEFGFYNLDIKEYYSEYITKDEITAAVNAVNRAKVMLAANMFDGEYESLLAAYSVLEAGKKATDEKAEALTADINRLIEETDLLVNKLAIFSPYTLQNNDASQPYYISSNAGHNTEEGNADGYSDGKGIAGLLDTDPDTYFHSRWGGTAVSEPHYLQIDLGDGNSVKDLIFTYAPRPGNSPAPTAIEVRVGDDLATIGESEPIAIYTKDKDNLPAYNTSILWTSNVIFAAESFRYIRLTVTKSAGPGNTQFGGQYFFAMGSLTLQTKTNESLITVKDEYSANVTKDLVKTAVNETYDSKKLLMATPTIVELQSAYNELKTAYNNIIDAAENSATTINVLNSTGEVTGTSTGKWYNTWTSKATLGDNAALKLSVGANNFTTDANDDYLRLYVGSGCTYTLTPAQGYYIESYSFDFVKDGTYTGTVNILVDGTTYNPTDENQSITSNHSVTESNATFSMSGDNKGIIVSNFKVTLKPIVTSYVTYNYYFNGNLIGTERLAAVVGGNYPAPNVVPKGYKASPPDGVVTALATVDIDCDIWSINIGGQLVDEWKPASWTTQLAADDIPEKITDVEINGTAVTDVWSNVVAIDIESPGYLSVDFARFSDGDNRLQMVGVDLLDNDGNVVASDYHFGYRGHNHDKSIYLLNIAEEGMYKLRYLVCFNGEDNTSNGEIDINLYDRLLASNSINGIWNTGLWKSLANEFIPVYIKENVKLVNNSGEHAVDRDVSYLETNLYIESGEINATINYADGNNRLEIVGVDLLDVYGNAIDNSNDYHFGYTGKYEQDNSYSLYVQNSGFYKLRILVCFKNEAKTSQGVFSVNLRDVYAEFKQVWDSAKEIVDNNESGKVGYYTDVTCDALGNVVEQYKDYSLATPLADVDAAREALATAAEALQINLPSSGKLYKIRSVSTKDYCKDKYVHTNRTSVVRQAPGYADNYYNHLHLLFDASVEPAPLAMFSFEATGTVGVYKMKNLHTGMYVKSFQKGAEHLGSESDASDVKVTGFAAGQLTLQIGESSPMHAQEHYGVIVGWGAEAGGASLWAIEEVDYSAADFDVTIGAVRWSTLCLSYAVQVPERVTAYAALGVEGNSVVLQSVGDVIPAGTPVLLNLKEDAADGTYTFRYVAESVEPQSQIDNKLVGTYFDSYIEADKENVKYYILAKINDTTAGMKQIYREYSYDENGKLVYEKNTDNGTHFKNNANKVYLPIPIEKGASEVKAYSLRIIDGTTGVDEVVGNIGLVPEGIYDLSGRRILEITEPGVYIVNGKKYIKK